jgi:hypothetical protein
MVLLIGVGSDSGSLKVCTSVCVLVDFKNEEGICWFATLNLQVSQMKRMPAEKRMQIP